MDPDFGNGIGQNNYLVQSGQDGSVWSMAQLKCYSPGAYPLNLPRIWSFSPDGTQHGMMIPSNAPPTVDAGRDAVIPSPTNQVSLNGKVVDDPLSPAPFQTSLWTCVQGPGTVYFSDATQIQTTAEFSDFGTYLLRLSSFDTRGWIAADEVSITYLSEPLNTPPGVDAGTNLTLRVLESGTLSGTVTDDGKPEPAGLTLWWTEVRGPGSARFADATAAQTSVEFDQPGDYLLRLSAHDGEQTSFDQITVTVLPDYGDPTYAIGDVGVFGTGEPFNFNGVGITCSSTQQAYSARFRALESPTADRVWQRLIGVDPGTTLQIGIQADDGYGHPDGTFLATTGTPLTGPPLPSILPGSNLTCGSP